MKVLSLPGQQFLTLQCFNLHATVEKITTAEEVYYSLSTFICKQLTCGGLFESDDHLDDWSLGLSTRMFLFKIKDKKLF